MQKWRKRLESRRNDSTMITSFLLILVAVILGTNLAVAYKRGDLKKISLNKERKHQKSLNHIASMELELGMACDSSGRSIPPPPEPLVQPETFMRMTEHRSPRRFIDTLNEARQIVDIRDVPRGTFSGDWGPR